MSIDLSGMSNNSLRILSMLRRELENTNFITFDYDMEGVTLVLYETEPSPPIEDDEVFWNGDFIMGVYAGEKEHGFTYVFCRDTIIEKGDPIWEEIKATVDMLLI